MNKISVKFIAESAILAALYAALTWLLAPISYGAIQFRLSEVLILLVVFKPKYAFAMIIGCFVANIPSSLGWYDMVFGTLATTLAVIPMMKIKRLSLAAILPVISNAFIVSIELGLAFDMFAPSAFWFNVLTVGIGEAVVLYLVGIPIMISISKNEGLVELLEFNVTNVKYNEKLTMTNTLSMTLGVIGVVLFIAYPFYQLDGTNVSALSMLDEHIWTILFGVIPIIFSLVFLLLKNKAKLIFSLLASLSLLIVLIMLGINVEEALSYPYYYGYIVYILLMIILVLYDYKSKNNNIVYDEA